MPTTCCKRQIRKITDQVELIDWLVEQVKTHEPRMISGGEVACFDSIAQEFRYGWFRKPPWGDYLSAVFDTITTQNRKVRCSPLVVGLSAEALARVIDRQGAGAEDFIALLLRSLRLQKRIVATERDGEIRFRSTKRFREHYGFRCEVTVKHGQYTELYRKEVGEPPPSHWG
ncbi:hypothetical protein [Mesorhizobium sp. M0011]|uniref:hypothetical protein n=1 Tax=Mesorhizobium sp. M0011 TaxID=2956839 RepID=UPI0033382E3B